MRIALFFFLVLFFTPALASVHGIKETDDGCTVLAKTSAVIMQARQSGAPMSNLLDIVNGAPESDRKILRLIVMAAYESPGFQSEEYKERAAMDFRNQIHLMCLQEREDLDS